MHYDFDAVSYMFTNKGDEFELVNLKEIGRILRSFPALFLYSSSGSQIKGFRAPGLQVKKCRAPGLQD